MIDIGLAAQNAIDTVHRNLGGLVYLDDGRCAGWFEVAGSGQGANRWTTRGSFVVSPVIAAPGSVCQYANQINNGSYSQVEITVNNGQWSAGVRGDRPISVKKPAVSTPQGPMFLVNPWAVSVRSAVRNAVAISPGPKVTSFSPLAGLSNQYRIR